MDIRCEPHAHTHRCWWHPLEARWVCPPASTGSGAPAADPPLVDTRDMLVVHTAVLREFRLAPAAVERVAPGDGAAARVVGGHLAFVCDMLHHHHEGEDELLWPLLRDRLPAGLVHTVREVEDQHADLDLALTAVGNARTAWAGDPHVAHRDALAGRLRHLHDLLARHLDTEERVVLPLAATVLTAAEWNIVGERAAASMTKPDLLLAMGMFAYEADPLVIRAMLASAPAAVRVVAPRIGARLYARRARRVHGTARP